MYIEKVEDLKKGDEILTPSGSNLIHAILLRDPVKRNNGSNWYKLTKCSINARKEEYDRRGWNNKTRSYGPMKRTRTKYEKDIINGSRIDKYLNLQDKTMIWLLNR